MIPWANAARCEPFQAMQLGLSPLYILRLHGSKLPDVSVRGPTQDDVATCKQQCLNMTDPPCGGFNMPHRNFKPVGCYLNLAPDAELTLYAIKLSTAISYYVRTKLQTTSCLQNLNTRLPLKQGRGQRKAFNTQRN